MLAWLTAAAAAFELLDEPRWAQGITLDRGAGTWELAQGLVYPVVDDGAAPAGFVFVGDGSARFGFASPPEALWFAAALVDGGEPVGSAAAALGGSWTEPFDRAVSLGVGPGDPPIASLPPAFVRNGVVSWVDAAGRETVVVDEALAKDPLGEARQALRERVRALSSAGLDPELARGLEVHDPAGRWVGEVRSGRSWRPFLQGDVSRRPDDRWLSFSADPTGAVDPERRDVVLVHGEDLDGARLWTVLGGSGEVRDPPEILGGVGEVAIEKIHGGFGAGIDARVELTVRAGPAGATVLPLFVPRRDVQRHAGFVTELDQLRILEVASPEGPLTDLGEAYGPRRAAEGVGRSWLLPRPLGPGEVTTLTVRWTDRWWVAALVDLAQVLLEQGTGGPPMEEEALELARQDMAFEELSELPALGVLDSTYVRLGRVTTEHRIWPGLGPEVPTWPAELRASTDARRWEVVLGSGTRREEQGDRTLWTVEGTAGRAVSVGELEPHTEPLPPGFPEVHVAGRAGAVPNGALVHAILDYFRSALPPFPYPELDVVQDRDQLVLQDVSTADPEFSALDLPPEVGSAPGQLILHGRQLLAHGTEPVASLRLERSVERATAFALARQWWDRPAYGPRDGWIGPAVAGYLRDRFVADTFGPEIAASWRAHEDLRLLVLHRMPVRGPLPLTGPVEAWSTERGARFLGELVEPRIGRRAMLAGLRAFLEGDEATTAALERALSAAGGVPLRGMFAAYVEAGFRPALAAEIRKETRGVRVEVRADPPFGAIEVPVAVRTRHRTTLAWVPVVDGAGSLLVPAHGEPVEVVLDPTGWFGAPRPCAVRR